MHTTRCSIRVIEVRSINTKCAVHTTVTVSQCEMCQVKLAVSSVKCTVWSVQCSVLFALCSVQCEVCSVVCCVVCCVHCAVYSVLCALCSVQCEVCPVHSLVRVVDPILYTLSCAHYILQCILTYFTLYLVHITSYSVFWQRPLCELCKQWQVGRRLQTFGAIQSSLYLTLSEFTPGKTRIRSEFTLGQRWAAYFSLF